MICLEIFLSFLRIGAFSFGGGLAMLPLIQQEVVLRNGWMSQSLFLDTIAIAEVTPGPIALNAATFAGFNAAGIPGGAVATLGVTLPSFLLCVVLSLFIEKVRHSASYKSVIGVVRIVATALILSTMVFLWADSVTGHTGMLLFVLAFALFSTERIHPALILLGAGLTGILLL